LIKHYSGLSPINIGTGEEVSTGELARMITETVSFQGDLIFDTSKPDGSPRKLLDVSRMQELGWKSSITLKDGLKSTYEWYQANKL
ncbi:MAG: GDP-L-fucose synthase, partial [Rhodospirillales bacterium]|jgi:GDP-L-fucose synthase|nr:GDP-L-fucose synthase [Rhodospirillales bacterium]